MGANNKIDSKPSEDIEFMCGTNRQVVIDFAITSEDYNSDSLRYKAYTMLRRPEDGKYWYANGVQGANAIKDAFVQ